MTSTCDDCGVLHAAARLGEEPDGSLVCMPCQERRDPIVMGGEAMHPLEAIMPDPCLEVCS